MRLASLAALAFAVIAACADPPADGTSADAGPAIVDDAGASLPDAGPPARTECACDGPEDCRGCFEHIGECCYEDATWFGQVDALVANCEANAACRTCCSECLAKTCAELIASNDCPIQ